MKVALIDVDISTQETTGTSRGRGILELKVVRTLAEVEDIRRIWSGWRASRDCDIDFCLQFVWCSEEFERPHVLVLYRHGRPDAMLIGRLERGRLQPRIGLLRFPGTPVRLLTFARGSLLGNASSENCNEFVRSIVASLENREAEAAFLHQCDVDSALYQKARIVPPYVSRDHCVNPVAHHVMSIPETVEQVYLGFSANLRADVRRKKRRFFKDLGNRVKFWTAHQATELDRVIPGLEEVAKKSYQRNLGVGFRDTERMRRRLRFCADKGWLRIYLLSVDDRPSAFWIGTLRQGSFCSDYLAFDPALGSYSPGTLLLMEMIEDLCKSGAKEIDFGFGEARYKVQFGNSQSFESSLWIFAPTARGVTLNTLQTSTAVIESAAKKLVERTRLVSCVKKFQRNHLAKWIS